MLFTLLLLELLGLFICLLHRLADFPLLLARLNSHCHASRVAALTRYLADCAFGIFPVRRTGTDFVSKKMLLVFHLFEANGGECNGGLGILVQRQCINHTSLPFLLFLEEFISTLP